MQDCSVHTSQYHQEISLMQGRSMSRASSPKSRKVHVSCCASEFFQRLIQPLFSSNIGLCFRNSNTHKNSLPVPKHRWSNYNFSTGIKRTAAHHAPSLQCNNQTRWIRHSSIDYYPGIVSWNNVFWNIQLTPAPDSSSLHSCSPTSPNMSISYYMDLPWYLRGI